MTMKARDLCDICKVSPVDEVLIQGSYNYKLMGSVLTNPAQDIQSCYQSSVKRWSPFDLSV